MVVEQHEADRKFKDSEKPKPEEQAAPSMVEMTA